MQPPPVYQAKKHIVPQAMRLPVCPLLVIGPEEWCPASWVLNTHLMLSPNLCVQDSFGGDRNLVYPYSLLLGQWSNFCRFCSPKVSLSKPLLKGWMVPFQYLSFNNNVYLLPLPAPPPKEKEKRKKMVVLEWFHCLRSCFGSESVQL